MPITLHFGVVEFPYGQKPDAPRRIAVRRHSDGTTRVHSRAASGQETTGDVAEILEAKYHIMELFVQEAGGEAIQAAVDQSVNGAIENILMGAPDAGISITADAESEIEDAFRLFLSLQLLDGIEPGVPTEAALHGVSHRFAHPYAKRGPRPSFIDTGLYEYSFTVWTD